MDPEHSSSSEPDTRGLDDFIPHNPDDHHHHHEEDRHHHDKEKDKHHHHQESKPDAKKRWELEHEPYIDEMVTSYAPGWFQAIFRKAQPYHPQNWVGIGLGLFVVFFGGQFTTLMLCLEVFLLVSWDEVRQNWVFLYKNLLETHEITKKKLENDEHTGKIAKTSKDDRQDNREALIKRAKTFLLTLKLSEIIDPIKVVGKGVLSIFAALKIRVFGVLTRGYYIGRIIYNFIDTFAHAHTRLSELKGAGWFETVFFVASIVGGVVLAFVFYGLIQIYHASFRGANFVMLNLTALLYKSNSPNTALVEKHKTTWNALLPAIIASLGFFYQLFYELPLLLALLFLPFVTLEWLISTLVDLIP